MALQARPTLVSPRRPEISARWRNFELPATNVARPVSATLTDLTISLFACSIVLFGFMLSSSRFQHWFVVPVTACGILIGVDAVMWLRAKLNVFDPVGVVGIVGVHFFFLAPLLHVKWDFWMRWVQGPEDWRPWLGKMACLNLAGLVIYNVTRRVMARRIDSTNAGVGWALDQSRFMRILVPTLVATGLLQLIIYAQSGGVGGYINSVSNDQDAFQGMGVVFMFSESFPIMAFIGYAVLASNRRRARNWLIIALVLVLYFVLKIFFGGLRGSRSNTIWGVVWAVGIVQLWLRPIPKKYIAVGAVFLFFFMYLYGFYKSYGLDAIDIVSNSSQRTEKSIQSGRTMEDTVLGDLGRSDVQAFLLYRLSSPDVLSDFDYAKGRTYISAITLIIPQAIWPSRPPTKLKEGTEVVVGKGAFEAGLRSSRIYGLAGESMLNFGSIVVPWSFIVLGIAVTWVGRRLLLWQAWDSRLLLIPFLVNLCFLILTSDSDNNVFYTVKNGFVPFTVLALSSKRIVRSHTPPEKGNE